MFDKHSYIYSAIPLLRRTQVLIHQGTKSSVLVSLKCQLSLLDTDIAEVPGRQAIWPSSRQHGHANTTQLS